MKEKKRQLERKFRHRGRVDKKKKRKRWKRSRKKRRQNRYSSGEIASMTEWKI